MHVLIFTILLYLDVVNMLIVACASGQPPRSTDHCQFAEGQGGTGSLTSGNRYPALSFSMLALRLTEV